MAQSVRDLEKFAFPRVKVQVRVRGAKRSVNRWRVLGVKHDLADRFIGVTRERQHLMALLERPTPVRSAAGHPVRVDHVKTFARSGRHKELVTQGFGRGNQGSSLGWREVRLEQDLALRRADPRPLRRAKGVTHP